MKERWKPLGTLLEEADQTGDPGAIGASRAVLVEVFRSEGWLYGEDG